MENAQEVYDKIVTHLRAQGKKAILDNGVCVYRLGCLKCAIGCLITDEEYDERMEGGGVRDLIWNDFTPKRIMDLLNEHYALCLEMQRIHDNEAVEKWEDYFQIAANHFNLIYTPPVKT